jgi:hypothetical protein
MNTKKVVLNIGLNNNTKSPDKIVELFQALISKRATWGQVVSTYNNETEPTLVLHGESALAFKTIVDTIKDLSASMGQECIGAEIDDQGLLIYPRHHKGERMKFDPQYFKKVKA